MELYSRNFTFWHETWNRHEKYFVSLLVDLHRIICILASNLIVWSILSVSVFDWISSAVKCSSTWTVVCNFVNFLSLGAPISVFHSTAIACGQTLFVLRWEREREVFVWLLRPENKSPRHSTSPYSRQWVEICALFDLRAPFERDKW